MHPDANDPSIIQRTAELLFVIFQPKAAFVLDIFDHRDWTNRRIVEIAISNWPNLDLFLELTGIKGSGNTYSESEHQQLRRAGITCSTEVNGRVFFGRGALFTAGTSIEAKRASARLASRLKEFEKLCADQPVEIASMLRKAGVKPPQSAEFEFVFLPEGRFRNQPTTAAATILPAWLALNGHHFTKFQSL